MILILLALAIVIVLSISPYWLSVMTRIGIVAIVAWISIWIFIFGAGIFDRPGVFLTVALAPCCIGIVLFRALAWCFQGNSNAQNHD